jgi:hypothetical protein
MNVVKNDPTFLDRRSGKDRRSGNDRRTKTLRNGFKHSSDLRSGFERRKWEEDRNGWVRVSMYSSADIGLPVDKL